MSITLDNVATLVVAILVLFMGSYVTNRVAFLQKYNIPTPVTGGVIISIVITILHSLGYLDIYVTPDLGNVLLLAFYVTIGLSAKFRLLFEGGRLVLILLVCAFVFLIVQNSVGVLGARLTGLDPLIGLLAGSITLSGGHGTGTAYAAIFQNQVGLENALEIALACATFGLIMAGLLGGPLATYLIKRHHLEPAQSTNQSGDGTVDLTNPSTDKAQKARSFRKYPEQSINYHNLLETIFLISLCIVMGVNLNKFFSYIGLSLPDFVPCLFMGIIITNFADISNLYKIKPKPLALSSNLSLDIFLAIAMTRLELWRLLDLAFPLLLILALQVLLAITFVYFIIFKVVGKTYTSSVISSGYLGFTLGATPTAIANMTSVTKHYGPAPTAFLVIPLVGAFFIDILNAIVIQGYLFFIPGFN